MMKSIAGVAVLLAVPAPGLAVAVADPSAPVINFDQLPLDGGPDFVDVAARASRRSPAATTALATLEIVPEPRVWLLLVAGYGMVGFALRKRGLLRHVAG
ncbi:hypothetical protein [Polymorphobacter megasporae]|uniref:hypothetical protein n=1 Tax=Glacieibacterium megasporae TaxID=2835787 RepID=UPI001C1E783F|nr:hypothetical protein [Polymorphobacter megasporae]UAJ11222.1 hypothetical protein KTC28_05815 [Polymorphobacter megasporae]